MKKVYAFNSVNGDRKYNADSITDDRRLFFTDGIIATDGVLKDELKVAPTSGMELRVGFGAAVIRGKTIELSPPDEGDCRIMVPVADNKYPRIDRAVLEMDNEDDVRDILIKVVSGVPSAVPVPPALIATDTIKQLSLARVLLQPGQSIITGVVDERRDSALCGVANVKLGVPSPLENVLVQYIWPCPPQNGVDTNYSIGTQVFIPEIMLHNLVKNPTFASIDNWRVFNGTFTASGNDLTITGLSGSSMVRLEQDIGTDITDDVTYFQTSVKINDTTGLKMLSISILSAGRTQVIKEITGIDSDTFIALFDMVNINIDVSMGFTFMITAEFTSIAMANGKILTITEPCIIDTSVDVDDVINQDTNKRLHDSTDAMLNDSEDNELYVVN